MATAIATALPVSIADEMITNAFELTIGQAYLYFNRIQLESANTPVDSGHTGKSDDAGKRRNQGPMVRVRDVLDKKDGDEIWVVIKGEVYECVEHSQTRSKTE